MKLNVRFILISFVIVICISVASTFIFYSLAGKVLTQQQTKSILNSTNDLAVTLGNELQKTDDEFRLLLPKINHFTSINLDSTSIDFLFTLINDNLINNQEFKVRTKSYLSIRSTSFKQFFSDNPNVILRFSQLPNGKTIYYGRLISAEVLTKIAEKIRSEVALVINDSPVEVSNQEKNQIHLLNVMNAVQGLKYKNNYDLYIAELDHSDFIASFFAPKFLLTPGAKVNFIVFESFKEGFEFRDTLRIVMILIVLAGSALTFIAVFLFTAKLRKQIVLLSEGAEITSQGDLDHRVPIITHDEIGHFVETFNKMLDELVRNKKSEQEYSEFITLINQNPTLSEIADAALSKIIKTTGLTFGVLYSTNNKSFRLISTYGINRNFAKPAKDPDLYENAIAKKEKIEFHFHENHPEIKTGIASIKIKYLMIYPIIYNKETIAILELASESTPQTDIAAYINSIHEQLAIGLVNANSIEQLENLVYELEKLNEDYQKQNKQTIEQNLELRELHNQIQEKAEELENQRAKAVELTRVKSEFLASMSHELRTPLISILGLTELLLKDADSTLRSKERLSIVHRNGKKLLGLINNILEFSKFESGRIEIKKEKFLLNDLLEEINNNISQIASEKDLKFIIEMSHDSNLLINSDKGKIEQILLNLLFNAVKFTDEGEVRLIITTLNATDISFTVCDTGIGISAEDQKIVFDEFRQVESGASRKYSGAGLGLAICKKYVELLGSSLNLKSELEKGSEFSFIIKESILDKFVNGSHKFLTISDSEDKRAAGESILIVNDNIDSQKLASDYLLSYNYRVFSVGSKKDALRIAREKLPNTIVINPLSHDIPVWELIAELKDQSATRGIRVVLTVILDEDKVGWKPNIYDFISEQSVLNVLEEFVKKHEQKTNRKTNRVLFVDKHKEKYSSLLNEGEKDFVVKVEPDPTKLSKYLSDESNQILMIDLNSIGASAIKYCYDLSRKSFAGNTEIFFLIPKEVSKKLSKDLTTAIRHIAKDAKDQPLEILKQLKESLGFIDEETTKRRTTGNESFHNQLDNKIVKKNGNKDDHKPIVLVVDDDNDTLYTVGEFIKEFGLDAMFAHNGMECLQTLSHVSPGLIFLDIMMPQMDGFETIKRIREDKQFTHIPVIALTAYAMLDNKEVIEKNGFSDLVTKPIDSQVLAALLKKYLGVGGN
jgi:signal transduction histidine kinase/CheY-like chemotaxis protein/HAMP domain-containing protein